MPGVAFQSKNTLFHDVEGSLQPVGNWSDSGLLGFFLFTGSLPRATINRARFQPDGVMSSTPPVAGSNYITFTGDVSWVQTSAYEVSEMTLVAGVRWQSNAGFTPMISTYQTPDPSHPGFTTNGRQLYAPIAAIGCEVAATYWTGSAESTQGSAVSTPGFNTWNFIIGRSGATNININNMTTNTAVSTVTPTGTIVVGTGLFRIGSALTAGTFTNSVDMCFAAIFARQLGNTELTPFYTQVQGYLASQGITI